MSFLLPKDIHKRNEVLRLAEEGLSLAQLEYLGVNTRIIGIIEENCGAIYLSQLLKMKDDQITQMDSLGDGGIKQIKNSLNKIFDLSIQMEKWHKSSGKVDEYKKKINIKKMLH